MVDAEVIVWVQKMHLGLLGRVARLVHLMLLQPVLHVPAPICYLLDGLKDFMGKL